MSAVAEGEFNGLLEKACDTTLAADPFTSLKPHFGMLLGVEDFQTLDAYHRGKSWLHNAWLHRHGVVWGLEVHYVEERGEIQVEPGLAIDAHGRELVVVKSMCLSLKEWLKKRFKEKELDATKSDFEARVEMSLSPCLGRQVPAVADPCDGDEQMTAYSRTFERAGLQMVPGLAPEPGGGERPVPYRLLRILFGLAEADASDPGQQEVLDERARIAGLPAGEQAPACLAAFRRFAAFDAMAMSRQGGHFPVAAAPPVVLAKLTGIHHDAASGEVTLSANGIDNTVRSTLVATATIQELLCRDRLGAADAASAGPAPEAVAPDAGGARVDPESFTFEDGNVSFTHAGPPLLAHSLRTGGIEAARYDIDQNGWQPDQAPTVAYQPSEKLVTVSFGNLTGTERIRVVIRGTGLTPAISRNRIPFAGHIDGPPGTRHEGHDLAWMSEELSTEE